MVLQIYSEFLSQPSRAVIVFARANNIDYEMKNQMPADRTPEFLSVNPRGQIPAIIDDGFKLYESHAILKYLAKSRSTPDHWYPADLTKRALVDCMLDWHHQNLREGRHIVFNKVFAKIWSLPYDETLVKKSTATFLASMKYMEDNWLTGEGPFLGGASEPSIADLSLVCEIQQMQMMERADYQEVMASREKILKWMQAIETSISPHYREVQDSMNNRLDEVKQQAS